MSCEQGLHINLISIQLIKMLIEVTPKPFHQKETVINVFVGDDCLLNPTTCDIFCKC